MDRHELWQRLAGFTTALTWPMRARELLVYGMRRGEVLGLWGLHRDSADGSLGSAGLLARGNMD